MNVNEAVEQYLAIRPKYEKLTEQLGNLLKDLLAQEGIKTSFERRTKEIGSFKEKITRTGKSYTDPLAELTDLCGLRVITYSLQDVEKVADLIRREFEVDPERSVDKLESTDPDRFGYESQHYIVRINSNRRKLFEWREIGEIWVEIQVRTILQHTWAVIDHELLYKKKDDAPRLLRRRLSRIMALFELADQELDQLIAERKAQREEYIAELAEEKTCIELNIDSLRSYLETAEEPRYWFDYTVRKIGVDGRYGEFTALTMIVGKLHSWNITALEELDNLLKEAHGWGEALLRMFYHSITSEYGIPFSDIAVSYDDPIYLLIIGTFAESILSQDTVQGPTIFEVEIARTAKKARESGNA